MDKTANQPPTTNMSSTSTMTSTEARTLRDVVYSSTRPGGNYGSLSKSQVQAVYYISHKVAPDDTFQRLALKYSISIQEIKRVNKLWTDAELGLCAYVYIPVNSTQLSSLQTMYPTLEVLQSLPTSANNQQKPLDEKNSSIRSSDSTNSMSSSSTTTTTNSSLQDYLSKIDQQIKSTRNSLQSLDIKNSSPIQNSPETRRSTTADNTPRHKGVHHSTDNTVFVNISTQNSRDKHVSAALKRIQQEQDNFDEL